MPGILVEPVFLSNPGEASLVLSGRGQEALARALLVARALVGRLRATGAQLGTVYGLTESCVAVAYNDDDADDATLAETVGRPDLRLELRIVDDDGREVAPGMPGEIQIRNPCLMSGYLHQPGANARGVHCRRVSAHGRYRRSAPRRQPHARRAREGHVQVRRLQRVPA